MRARLLPVAVTASVILAISLGGCVPHLPHALTDASSVSASPTPTATHHALPPLADPATGVLLQGSGYTAHAPQGWSVPKDAPSGPDIYAVGPDRDTHGAADTINVIIGPASSETLDEAQTDAVDYLEQVVGATGVLKRRPVDIAGSDSVHVAGHLDDHGVPRWTEQYLVAHDGNAFTISFTFREDVARADREETAESVLASWEWGPSSAASAAASAGYVYEDSTVGYAVSFPQAPSPQPLKGDGIKGTATLALYGDPSTIAYAALGEIRDAPIDLHSELLSYVDGLATGQISAGSADLDGLPALTAEFSNSDGAKETTIIAARGSQLFQLIVAGGTPAQAQAFFDSFELRR